MNERVDTIIYFFFFFLQASSAQCLWTGQKKNELKEEEWKERERERKKRGKDSKANGWNVLFLVHVLFVICRLRHQTISGCCFDFEERICSRWNCTNYDANALVFARSINGKSVSFHIVSIPMVTSNLKWFPYCFRWQWTTARPIIRNKTTKNWYESAEQWIINVHKGDRRMWATSAIAFFCFCCS